MDVTGEKTSRYLVISERGYRGPDGAAMRILYATRTGSAACVPTAVAAALREGRIADIDASDPDTGAGLRAIEAIVPAGEDERATVLARQRTASADEADLRYVLLPTRYCNMGCEYCGQEHTRGNLGRDHRDAVAARVLGGIATPGTESVSVSWFGAEPMVGYPAVRELSARFTAAADARGVEYRSRMVTNGSLLTAERLRVLNEECRVTQYDITLDGPARIHNVHRPLKNGGSSFNHIIRIVSEALADPRLEGVTFTLRTNIDVENAEWVDEYIDLMAGYGFADDRVNFNLAPVYPWGNDVSRREIPRDDYARREVAWMDRMRRLGLRFVALPTGPIGKLCAAVTRSAEVVSSSGTVFSCSEYPLVPQHEATGGLGTVTDLPAIERRPVGPFDDWHDAIAAGETACHSCVIMPVCGGACPKQWREGIAPCPPIKFSLQERMGLVAGLNGLEPEDGPVPAGA